MHRVAPGKDADEPAVGFGYQHRADAALAHAPAGIHHGCFRRQHQRLPVAHDIRHISHARAPP
jgi:hypothetical protein